jgi:hypothetical protein
MIELLLPSGFNTVKYSWVKDTIGICMLADYSMAKKCQQGFIIHHIAGLVRWALPTCLHYSPLFVFLAVL